MSNDTIIAILTPTSVDADRAVAVVTLAFAADPALRWGYPDPLDYVMRAPGFMRALGGRAFEHGTADCLEDYGGVALWLPPGVEPDAEAVAVEMEHGLSSKPPGTAERIAEQMSRFHPHAPHWYLPFIAVDPRRQRNGLGSKLLERAVTRCDDEGVLAYLESSNPLNQPLYERHGFVAVGRIQAADMPPVIPMVREPGSRGRQS